MSTETHPCLQMIKMNQDDFVTFRNRSLQNLVIQRAEDFGEDKDTSVVKAQEKFNEYLPHGLQTPGHYFYELKDDQMSACGYLWFGEREEYCKKKIFIYDILVEENERGKGFGKWMLHWLEKETQKMNLHEISLHVLGCNYIARELYESLGFEMTNIYMSKKI